MFKYRYALVVVTAIVATVAIATTVFASGNFYTSRGEVIGDNGNYGLWNCYQASNNYFGLVNFYDSTGDGSFVLDGQGSCLTQHGETKGFDLGSRIGPVNLWSGTGAPGDPGSYKWSIREDGSLVPLNGTAQIGQEGGWAHFNNPLIYATDVRVGDPSWSLNDRIAAMESRIATLETGGVWQGPPPGPTLLDDVTAALATINAPHADLRIAVQDWLNANP